MTEGFEVPEPIICSPFEEPATHWYLVRGELPERRKGRRPAEYLYHDPRRSAAGEDRKAYAGTRIELKQVNLIRKRLAEWRGAGYPGATAVTLDLLQYWRRDGREQRLFFAQIEAAETIIFLSEARSNFLQGFEVPREKKPAQSGQANGNGESNGNGANGANGADGAIHYGFHRYACKMATGTGKTTVMAMLAAWSILNKSANRQDTRFSDVVLVVCPNITIRNRLRELDPRGGDGSLYHTRDLVPPTMLPRLAEGHVLVHNWHIFERQPVKVGGDSSRVLRAGEPETAFETVTIGEKTTTARGRRYMRLDAFEKLRRAGMIEVEKVLARDKDGSIIKARVKRYRYMESSAALVKRILHREIGGKNNILVFNDEGHHAYRIQRSEPERGEGDNFADSEESESYLREAAVWIEGLDHIHEQRGINFCVDLSATPYYLARAGTNTNRIFPWVVSDFGLTDAIESGLVKVPQLAVRDTTGADIPGYFNIWNWILPHLTASERGGRQRSPKPEAILKWSNHPITMLAGLWMQTLEEWSAGSDGRPPVFIIICKNTALAKVIYEWLAENKTPFGIPPASIPQLRNENGKLRTIRVDTKVIGETDRDDREFAKSDENAWMRFQLDTAGKLTWPRDSQGRDVFPEGFEVLAKKLKRPLHPPGRDLRCIVSVSMLTEGWDCSTVTHIVGLRPFMSQLLCEQVVGRGLRRRNYEIQENGLLGEEVAKIFGVPFEMVPFKESGQQPQKTQERHHIHALPGRKHLEIHFPRVDGYRRSIRRRVALNWDSVSSISIDPGKIAPEVEMKAQLPANQGRPSLLGPGKLETADLERYRATKRVQAIAFDMAAELTKLNTEERENHSPAQFLFPQFLHIVRKYFERKVHAYSPAKLVDIGLSPYYGWALERLNSAIVPDTAQGEAPELPRYELNRGPGSTSEVDFWTSKPVREVTKSHVNMVVADTARWEQAAAYILDTHPAVFSFVKNASLGFAIPYLHNESSHDYVPDFLVLLKDENGEPGLKLILETKGFDELEEIKTQAARRWVAAVNADGSYGQWHYEITHRIPAIRSILDRLSKRETAA